MDEFRSWELATQQAFALLESAIRMNPDVTRERESSERYEMRLRFEMDAILGRDETKWMEIHY